MWRGDVLRGGCGYRPAPRTLPESARICEAWIKKSGPALGRARHGCGRVRLVQAPRRGACTTERETRRERPAGGRAVRDEALREALCASGRAMRALAT